MQSWLAEQQPYLILIILIDGVVMTLLAAKHRTRAGGMEPGLDYFWMLTKQRDADGIVAIVLTALAVVAGALMLVALAS